MAKTILNGGFVSATYAGALSNPLHSAPGRLIAFLISHTQATVQTVIFYDCTGTPGSGDEFLVVHVAPEQSPYYVEFARDAAIPFSTGLRVSSSYCEIAVWSVDHG